MSKIIKDEKGKTLYYVTVDLILTDGNGNILLQRRANTGWQDGMWCTIGGHIDDDETWEQTIVREAKEEIGIIIEPQDLKMLHCLQHKTNRLTINWFMGCSKYKGIPTIQPELCDGKQVYKADALQWFSINNLPDNIVPSTKQALQEISKSSSFSKFGF